MSEPHSPSQQLMEAFFRFSKLHMLRPREGHRPPEMVALYLLNKAASTSPNGLKISELSNLMRVTPPMVTQLVNSLEARGLVIRSMDAEDRRAVRVSITEAGRLVQQQAVEAFLASFDRLVARLGREKSMQLAELLAEVFDFVSSEQASRNPHLSDKQRDEPSCSTQSENRPESTNGGDALL
ncbi:MAG: MarR family winged helix-turn-helix transcriptional regulator [Bacillota bacterium]